MVSQLSFIYTMPCTRAKRIRKLLTTEYLGFWLLQLVPLSNNDHTTNKMRVTSTSGTFLHVRFKNLTDPVSRWEAEYIHLIYLPTKKPLRVQIRMNEISLRSI